ncbi:hypothetical protein BPC006_I1136 [Burkholderia pseudomallei BPC006]|nr:hypothetical protein BPC006_I1136 [Burkholderia pseudomallei BPC006]
MGDHLFHPVALKASPLECAFPVRRRPLSGAYVEHVSLSRSAK